ncbi:hypothetical protein QCA50_003903 [Cerrena zonata]|uniref:Uncharacterized protein n=1 Tax=Cerrena zonata TaxID=2478898 RepID=A0AAW0GFG1_9APHY
MSLVYAYQLLWYNTKSLAFSVIPRDSSVEFVWTYTQDVNHLLDAMRESGPKKRSTITIDQRSKQYNIVFKLWWQQPPPDRVLPTRDDKNSKTDLLTMLDGLSTPLGTC